MAGHYDAHIQEKMTMYLGEWILRPLDQGAETYSWLKMSFF